MKKKVLIVDANFYEDLASELVRGAVAELEKMGISYERLSVPGALEIPSAISLVSQGNEAKLFAGYIALGCVIRGETSHYDIVCGESARGLSKLALDKNLAIGNGILTVDNWEQAWARASVLKKNKGRDAAIACLSLFEIKQRYIE
ncbi:MAG: 6,7-dimethyl-8-ribityllumazine synthase [Thalassobaculaceae bacterium]|jgi:6,7-dimethyl-8-ribityllumazine synthase|nr:6,7-dimethyl-8-ribityllumazine synthase [Rhodospirillaceae bacterium]MAR89088.1 6,7-dimethyl-8-ribityllumazine synthase [Rhodospirillaceae bacterium]OUU61907.1 MAG: 6,7-dimethyl-8-ribityllumazine synthase [Candidatus Endolissoclinum sp. TMED55]|tara:strand:+ start:124 stop:561 length:438 start_codon:yes stop_codon:yes gene_type:complete